MKRADDKAASTSHELHDTVVDPELAAEIRAAFERTLHDVASVAGLDRRNLGRLVSAWNLTHPSVRHAMQTLAPRVRASLLERQSALAPGLGDPVDASLFVVTGEQGHGTHAHQDIAYKWNRPVDARYAYTTWIALDACGHTSGALRFRHGWSAREAAVRQDFLRADFVDLASTVAWRKDEAVACASRGDVVVFDALAWHASAPVVGDRERMALAIRWRSIDGWEKTVPLEAPVPALDVFGMDTSGRLLCDAMRRACGHVATSPGMTVRDTLRELQEEHPAVLARMSPGGRAALEDLSLTLWLGEEHHARPAAAVWHRIRDIAIPDLESLSTGGLA
jgi:ectoine hydroxylase-related dioxygenase (phytanoyl-CoA dioxygenase family)